MDVEFKSKTMRRHVIHRPQGQGSDTVIKGGRFTTQDKKEIEDLLGHEDTKKQHIQLGTQPELVEQYLNDDEPDKITKEVLADVTKEGLEQLVDYFGVKGHGYMPTVMKNMLVGEYIDNKTKSIIDGFQAESDEERVEDLLEIAKDKGIVEHRKPWYVFVPLDKGIGRNPADATKWLATNKSKLDEEIEKIKGDNDATEQELSEGQSE